MKIGRLLSIISIFLVMACSSGKKAYERGNYYESVMQAVGRLRQNTDHKKSVETLKNAYPLSVESLEDQAKNQIATNSQFKWKNAILSYNQINNMYEAIRQCPGCLKVIPNPKNYYTEVGELKLKAAAESYDAGITALMKGTRNDAKNAYFLFADVDAFAPGFKDVQDYLNKSMDEATLKVVIEQIPVPTRYNLSGGFFQDKVEEFLHNNYQQRSFIQFLTPDEAQRINLARADQILRIQFDDFTVGNTNISQKEETISRDSVIVGEVVVDGKKIPAYNTVKAKLTTYRKEVISQGLLSMIVVDANTKGILSHQKFNGGYTWVSTWANFSGDDRALTQQQLAMCKQRETQPPLAQDLFLEFTRPLYDQLIPGIRRFYGAY